MDKARLDLESAQVAFDDAGRAQAKAVAEAEQAERDLILADNARTEAQSREGDARAERSEAEGELNALRAEAAALSKLVDRDTAEGGQILDVLQVEDGFEKALGAALADDLRAPEVELDMASGWAELPRYTQPQLLPGSLPALTNHVTVPPVLVRRMSQVGLVSRSDGPTLQADLMPGQRLVSLEGDLWRWDGFRAAAEDAPSAAALRLQQLNRLERLKRDLEDATARADGAMRAHDVLKASLVENTKKDAQARDARRAADRAMADASRTRSKAEADQSIAAGQLETLGLAVARYGDEAQKAALAVSEAKRAVDALGDMDIARGQVESVKLSVEAARLTMLTKRSSFDELRRAGEARVKRTQEITKEVSGWRHRLQTAEKRIAELEERKEESESALEEALVVPGEIVSKREEIREAIEAAQTRRATASDRLAEADTALRAMVDQERKTERTASEARETRAGAEARATAGQEAVEFATQRILDEMEATPETLLARLDVAPDDMPESHLIEANVNRLKRQRDALGAVNLRAEEDSKSVEEEHSTLLAEKTDLEEAIKALQSGISSLNREGRERLLTAFEQVNENFSLLFKHLFGGGEAKLVLVESDDPLEAGLEIMCQPPGKKLSTLSLLSGGEQTLTALALIFGVFLANPAPICVLDEVDAPLDDANVTRFCDLLDEMTRQTDTRFLIITHHAVTMARMDRLFGVTMGEQGVSQLVSVDLKTRRCIGGLGHSIVR